MIRFARQREDLLRSWFSFTLATVSVIAFLLDWSCYSALAQEPTSPPVLTLKGHAAPVQTVAFSPDGKSIASGDSAGIVKISDASNGKELFSLKGQPGLPPSVAYSPDGKLLAYAGGRFDKPGEVKVWETASGNEIQSISGLTHSVESQAFLDSKRLAGGSGQTVKVWDVSTGREVMTLRGHTANVNCIACASRGKRLVSAAGNNLTGEFIIWDLSTGQAVLTVTDRTFGVALSCDGKRLASISSTGRVQINVWDMSVQKGVRAFTFNREQGPHRLAFSPDSKYLVCNCGHYYHTVTLWDVTTGQEAASFKVPHGRQVPAVVVTCVAFSPDGKRLATASSDGVKIWDVLKLVEEKPKEPVYMDKPLSAWIRGLKVRVPYLDRTDAVRALSKVGSKTSALQPLSDALRDPDTSVRLEAATALGQFGPDAVPALAKALKDSDELLRRDVCGALAAIGPEAKAAVPALVGALKDPSPIVRLAAVRALGEIGQWTKEVVDALAAILRDKNAMIRAAAVTALGETGKPGVASLQEALTDENAGVRNEAAFMLGQLGPEAKPAIVPLRRLLKDTEPGVRIGAACALARISPEDTKSSVALLVDGLKDAKNFRLLGGITSALGRIGPQAKAAVPALIELLREGGPDLKPLAAEALGCIGPEAKLAVPLLIEALKDEIQPIRFSATFALKRIGPEAKTAEAALTDALKDEDAGVRILAAAALARINPKNMHVSTDLLNYALQSEEPHDRMQATFELGEIGAAAKRMVPAIVALLKDSNRQVREAAAAALKKIDPESAKKAGVP
jgi:HEAT repeat protein/WD40 repeat protein